MKSETALRVLTHALPHVAFDGWTMKSLKRGAEDANVDPAALIRLFPGGVMDALAVYHQHINAQMLEAYRALPNPPQKIREKIAMLVRLRLEAMAPHREAARRAKALLSLPPYLLTGTKLLWDAADAMWYEAGDTATDFNWYTKRALLCGVYTSTLQFWLHDESTNYEDTWKFLAARIENVMQIEKFKAKFKRAG